MREEGERGGKERERRGKSEVKEEGTCTKQGDRMTSPSPLIHLSDCL